MRYLVNLRREETHKAKVRVEAASREDAQRKALIHVLPEDWGLAEDEEFVDSIEEDEEVAG